MECDTNIDMCTTCSHLVVIHLQSHKEAPSNVVCYKEIVIREIKKAENVSLLWPIPLEHIHHTTGYFGTLSRDPNSTLGRGGTYKKTDLSSSASASGKSIQSPSSYELNTNLQSVNETGDTVTETETETKVDLGTSETSAESLLEKVAPKEEEEVKPRNLRDDTEEKDGTDNNVCITSELGSEMQATPDSKVIAVEETAQLRKSDTGVDDLKSNETTPIVDGVIINPAVANATAKIDKQAIELTNSKDVSSGEVIVNPDIKESPDIKRKDNEGNDNFETTVSKNGNNFQETHDEKKLTLESTSEDTAL